MITVINASAVVTLIEQRPEKNSGSELILTITVDYEVIVDKAEGRIKYHVIEIESE